MADIQKQKQNISVTPDSLQIEMSGGYVTAISGIPVGGNGGSGPAVIYHGDNINIKINPNSNVISLTESAAEHINTPIPSKVSDLTDSANYATNTYVDYTFQPKEDMDDYYTKADALTAIQDLQDQIDNKQNKLGFGLTTGNEISSIGLYNNGQIVNTTAIYTGEGGGESYSAGTDIYIHNGIIQVNTNGETSGAYNFVEGNTTNAKGGANHAEGAWTIASGSMNHSEGVSTSALGYGVHAQGMWTCFSSYYDPENGNIYWADGAGATVEGYCNATTSCPMSGTKGQSDYGPIHGGVIKVIGNGYIEHDQQPDPQAHTHTHHQSDALIIFKDGTISAFGDIYKNDKKFITEGNFAQGNAYAMTTTGWEAIQAGGQGIQQVLHDDTLIGNGADNDNKLGVATSAIQPVSGMTAYATTVLLDNVSGELKEQINTKLDKTFSSNFYPMNSNPNGYLTTETDWTNTIQEASAKAYNDATANANSLYLTTAQYNTDSATFALKTDLNDLVSSAGVTTTDTDYVMTTTGWKVLTLPGGGMTQVYHDNTLTGDGNANDNQLGVKWESLSSNTINSALSAGSATSAESATNALSSRYAKQLQDASKTIQISDVTALQNWASSNSATWDSVSAKLTTAQYATDSATFVTSSNASISAAGEQYVLTTTGWANVGTAYLPTSGGTVSGDVIVKSTGTNLLAVNTTANLMGQSRVANLTDTTAIGTNWLGVNSNGGGFLKNVQGGNVGALNGTSIQIDFAPDGANSYGNITVNSQGNSSKIVHVPTASYNSMSSFDNTNGPNYMLRKTASGFDIGAAVINVQSLPAQTEANAYYFVYDA